MSVDEEYKNNSNGEIGQLFKANIAFILFFVIIVYDYGQAMRWQPEGDNHQIQIWPNAAPGGQIVKGPENSAPAKNKVANKSWLSVTNVVQPTITIYPPKTTNTGVTIVVFPGGGYQVLAIDLEGTEVCDWFTLKGVTCVLLKYRVPYGTPESRSGPYPLSAAALQDAQRAMGLLRHNAVKWNLNPNKIGVLGFSAGGHLAAAISTNFKKRLYPLVDGADQKSCRPDFAIPIYPGHMAKDYNVKLGLNPFLPVLPDTPPTLLVHAKDDKVDPIEYSLLYQKALEKNKVLVEIHIFEKGGHAFGLRKTELPIANWPKLAEEWLVKIGMISKKEFE